jgi:RHS repeat-associated protein
MRQTDGTNTIDFQYDAGGRLVGFLCNEVPYYYLRNVLNDISGVVDGDGNVVAKYRYDAYGNTILASGTMAEINPIRYRGYYYDTETNWYYLQSRYYNPEWCRFISPDNLFIAGDAITGSNMYAYCNDNPILYVDPTGTAAEESFWGNVIGNAIWASAKLKSYVYLPVSWAAGALSHSALVTVKSNEKLNVESVAELPTVANALPIVKEKIADKAMPRVFAWAQEKFPVTTSTFNAPTGLRHFMPINMEFGAEWASYLLGFKYCEYGKYVNYTSSTDTPMWQSVVGYSPVYDFFFSVGGPIFKDKYPFMGNDNKYYIIWIWKADYWNLGAGAEIGIYSTDNPDNVEQEFYEVDTNLRLQVDMTVKYKTLGLFEKTLNHFEQENWWVCSFTPEVQLPNLNWLSVDLKVKFKDESLMTPFYLKKEDLDGDVDEWDEISWTDVAYTERATGHESHRCGCEHPALCACKDIYSCCSSPCMYYTENGDEFSGYQFNINY